MVNLPHTLLTAGGEADEKGRDQAQGNILVIDKPHLFPRGCGESTKNIELHFTF